VQFSDSGEQPGDYTLQIVATGTDPDHLSRSQSVALHVVSVNNPTSPGTLNVPTTGTFNPTPPTCPGGTGCFSITTNGGTFPGAIQLSCTGFPAGSALPAGITSCSVTPSSFTPSTGSQTQQASVSITTNSLNAGTYTLAVIADPGNGLAAKSNSFTVKSFGTFAVNMTGQTTQTVLPGTCPGANTCATFTGNVSTATGYSSSVALSCGAGAPTSGGGGSCTVSPTSVVPGNSFTVTASNTTPAPAFNFSISGSGPDASANGGTQTQTSNQLTLNVGGFTFTGFNPTSVSATTGNPSGATSFTVAPTGAFSGTVLLTCTSGLPTGAKCNFFPNNGTATTGVIQLNPSSGTVTGNVTVVSPGATCTCTVKVTATSNGSSQSQTFTLNVTSTGAVTVDMKAALGAGAAPNAGIAQLGKAIAFTATFTNASLATPASGVTLFFDVSQPVQVIGNITLPSGCTSSLTSLPVQCTLSSPLAAGSTVTVKAAVVAPFARALTGIAQTGSSDSDPTSANNSATKTIQIRLRPLARKGLTPKIP
jgi:hypothetical protein